MSRAAGNVEQHLRQWVAAYGPDLAVPAGRIEPRVVSPAAPPPELAASPEPRPVPPSDRHAPKESGETEPTDAPSAPRPSEATTLAATESPAAAALRALRAEVLPCTRCQLHAGRRMTVFGEGSATARVMFVGEAPGAKEDQSGRPFVGPAGQLLDRIISGAMGLRREDVFIANVNKCRPPNNRAPEADEVAACLPFLKQQVEIVCPEVIVCLGERQITSAQIQQLRSGCYLRVRGRTVHATG